MNTYQPTSIEPFSPGAVRKMKNALLPLRDQMGFEIVRDLNLLDDPVAFLAMCQRIGYQGLGATYDTTEANDLNTAIGQRLIDTWRIIAVN